jgi:hypothetical protein
MTVSTWHAVWTLYLSDMVPSAVLIQAAAAAEQHMLVWATATVSGQQHSRVAGLGAHHKHWGVLYSGLPWHGGHLTVHSR